MNNGGAPFRTGGYSDWHGMSRLSPVFNRILTVILRLSPGQSRFNKVCASYNLGSTIPVNIMKYAKLKLYVKLQFIRTTHETLYITSET